MELRTRNVAIIARDKQRFKEWHRMYAMPGDKGFWIRNNEDCNGVEFQKVVNLEFGTDWADELEIVCQTRIRIKL